MIVISPDGTILPNSWKRSQGLLIKDTDSPYRKDFAIALPYTKEQTAQWKRELTLKNQLLASDYWDNKYIEGEYTEEEWAAKKAQRKAWRDEIREIEKDFVEPTITREEMNEAERKAMGHLKAMENAQYIYSSQPINE